MIIALLMALSSSAYIPPFNFVLEKSTEKKSKIKFLDLGYEVTAFQDQRATTIMFKESFQIDTSRDLWMSEVKDDQGKVLFSEKKKISDDATALATLLQFDDHADRIQRSLTKMGFKVDRSKLDRIPPHIAWTYGQNIQLWFVKDQFTPFRWSHPNSKREKGNPVEIQFLDYKSHKDILPIPQTILVSSRGQTLFRAELKTITMNEKRVLSADAQDTGWSATGEAASPAMKELIERYYTHIR